MAVEEKRIKRGSLLGVELALDEPLFLQLLAFNPRVLRY
jgi:hypothetical protein